jgi:ribonuclease R
VRGYCHFTSPIRRYPDLFDHRRVKAWLGADGPAPAGGEDDLEVDRIARDSTYTEQRAQEAERESTRVKALRLAAEHLGEDHDGTIVGVVPVGLFVEIEDPPVDGFLRLASWVDDDFTMDEAGVRLVGRRTRRKWTLGDKVRVRLARVDIAARELELALEGPAHGGRGGGRRAKNARDPGAARHRTTPPRSGHTKPKHKKKGR